MPRLTFSPPALVAMLTSSAVLTYAFLTLTQAPPARTQGPWRLQPGDVETTGSIDRPVSGGRQLPEIPDERRMVRIIAYPGPTPAR